MYGSHLSIAGSMLNALAEAKGLGLDTVQVFTKNQQQWKAKPLDPSLVADWNTEVARLGWNHGCSAYVDGSKGHDGRSAGRIVSHASYLINLAGPDETLWRRSVDLMTDEVERCEALGIPWLVHHPGSYTTTTPEAGISRIALAYKEVFARTRGGRSVCCLENTVGSGSNLGRDFGELGRIREAIVDATGEPDRVAFCIDTCHAHAGGYDLSTRQGGEAMLKALDEACGLHRVRVIHLNDSKKPAGSRRDFHEHIGRGTIGGPLPGQAPTTDRLAESGFWTVVRHPAFGQIPKVLETPKGQNEGGTMWDLINLRRLRSLSGERQSPIIDEPIVAATSTKGRTRASKVAVGAAAEAVAGKAVESKRPKVGVSKTSKAPTKKPSPTRRTTKPRASGIKNRGKSKHP